MISTAGHYSSHCRAVPTLPSASELNEKGPAGGFWEVFASATVVLCRLPREVPHCQCQSRSSASSAAQLVLPA